MTNISVEHLDDGRCVSWYEVNLGPAGGRVEIRTANGELRRASECRPSPFAYNVLVVGHVDERSDLVWTVLPFEG